MQHRCRFFTGTILTTAAGVILAGCGSEEPVATSAATRDAVPVPTYSELRAAVQLDDADEAVVKQALGEWQDAAARGASRAAIDGPRPAMQFVATVAPSLDNAQLEGLVGFLVEYREGHATDGHGRFAARRGERRHEQLAARIERRIERMDARTEAHVEWLTAVLGLSNAQQSQVHAALSPLAEKRKAALIAFAKGTLGPGDMRRERREERVAMAKALEGILTEEQSARWKIVRQLHHHAPRDF